MTASCLRFCPIARVMSFAAVLVIDVFAVADPANHNNASLDIKQDSVIPHPQPICCLRFAQTLDVAMQTALQSLDLAQNLRALLRRELIQLLKGCFAIFDLEPVCIHPARSGSSEGGAGLCNCVGLDRAMCRTSS